MTATAWNTFVDQSSDAAFRTWGLEFNTKLSFVGMVQTADTGQINWSTVTRAAISSVAGYEIWKLSSGNLYFKIEYGSGTATTIPAFWITVGTGSNGSGTLTGQTSTRAEMGQVSTAIASTTTNYQSYLCATANYFGISWKLLSASAVNSTPRLFFTAAQTVDNTGTATSVGYEIEYTTGIGQTHTCQCVATTAGVTGAVVTGNNINWFVPNNVAGTPPNSLDGAGNNQAFLHWFSILGTTPMIPMLHVATALFSDIGIGVTASMTLVGTTAHTYMGVANGISADVHISAAAQQLVMLYE